MSEKKYSENDPERTLITLDQLSQTIEVMTSVVNRLRQHLSEQVMAKREIEELEKAQERARAGQLDEDEQEAAMIDPLLDDPVQQGVCVEVSKPEADLDELVDEKTIH